MRRGGFTRVEPFQNATKTIRRLITILKTAKEDEGSNENNVATSVEDVDNSDWSISTFDNIYTLSNSNRVEGDIQVWSITGTVVWTKNHVNSNSVQIDMNSRSAGIYIIQVVKDGERVYVGKFVKN